MLETHRLDARIVEAVRIHRNGMTSSEIQEYLNRRSNDPVSLCSIRRHLPGLVVLRVLRGEKAIRDKRWADVWKLYCCNCQQINNAKR